MSDSILSQLAALKRLPTAALKAKHRELLGSEPNARNRAHMESRLSYRLQELALGGLSEAVAATLDALAASEAKPVIKGTPERPVRGTRFLRVWQGVEHVVTTTDTGFEWQARPFGSLSAVARAITGTRWNGHLFFGLRGKRKVTR